MRNRGIGRARMFMGALLLLAAMLTWGIGLTMSAHGDTVAPGTEYLRSTILTFKRNGAIGTLILCTVGAWLLFPARRPKWPARDAGLIALLVFLAGSSIYTLISLQSFGHRPGSIDENLTGMDLNVGDNLSAPTNEGAGTNVVGTALPETQELTTDNHLDVSVSKPRHGSTAVEQQPPRAGLTGDQADVEENEGPAISGDEPLNNMIEENHD